MFLKILSQKNVVLLKKKGGEIDKVRSNDDGREAFMCIDE